MTSTRDLSLSLLTFALLSATAAGTATADEPACASDADCGPGAFCLEGWCAGEAPIPGEPEDWMPEPGCQTDADCEAGQYCLEMLEECVPQWFVACTSDTDCGAGLSCVDLSEFDGGWGEDDWDDDGGAEPMPMPIPPSMKSLRPMNSDTLYCLPEWLLPRECESDADCGDGFTCEAQEICGCAGGGGSGGSGWDDVPPMPGEDFKREDAGEDCFCEPTGESYCEIQEIACDSASDCPADWTCEEWGGGDVACSVDSDGNTSCDDPETGTYCAPPYFEDIAAGGGLGGGFEENDSTSGGGTGVPRDDDAAVPGADAGGGGGGASQRPDSDGGGCAATPAGGSGGAAVFGLLGLLGLVRRRRA